MKAEREYDCSLQTCWKINTREREELFKLKDGVGVRGNGYKPAMNKSRRRIRKKVSNQQSRKTLNSLPYEAGGGHPPPNALGLSRNEVCL